MILADKIIQLRKKAGWSQEELAEQLGVTRQSVSKWEGAQSVPDLEKVLQLSSLFHVTTDYLLKDDAEEAEAAAGSPDSALRRVTMEEASAFLQARAKAAPKIAWATFLCVISPVLLIVLAGLADNPHTGLSENLAAGLGLCALVLLAAAGTALFILAGTASKPFAFLEKEPFETAYGVDGMVRERRKAFRSRYVRMNAIATVMCICSVMPLLIAACLELPDGVVAGTIGLMMVIVAFACVLFIDAGVRNAAMDKLLEEEEFTRARKAGKNGWIGAFSAAYWLVVTAFFLCVQQGVFAIRLERTWLIWAVAGILYAAVLEIVRAIVNRKQ